MLPNGRSLYGTIRLAVKIELMGLVIFRLLTTYDGRPARTPAYSSPPRTHVRYRVPYAADTHDSSPIMSVFEVPSEMDDIVIAPSRWKRPEVAAGTPSCSPVPTG